MSSASHRLLPLGVVTFLFTDIEGSTRLLHKLGDAYGEVLQTHHALVRDCIRAHDGTEVDTEGDAFFVAFSSPYAAVAAAVDAQRALLGYAWPHGEPVRVRMGLHTGEPLVVDENYVGMDVHRAARICHAAHGGQVVVSARVGDLLGDRLPEGLMAIRDLGHHWLKDLAAPEHLLQLDIEGLPTSFPPLQSMSPPTNVPRQVADLVGRLQEKADLRALLTEANARLVTVTGPGGAGKTRLAAAVALDLLERFPHGVHFVDLSDLDKKELVLPAIARVLHVPLEGDESAQDAVAGRIGDKRMLLLLDNFERVLDAAVAVAGLLRSCPGLRALVTSRVLLGLQDEQEYALPPMGLPRGNSLREIRDSEAVELFVARASMARQDFELTEDNATAVAEACRLLDGLPLAIQLAASRIRLFAPRALVGKLEDRLQLLTSATQDIPTRHRTMRATVDWSYALLDEAERRFFRDFAVFSGGARLESVEAVVTSHEDVLSRVTSLVNHSLLVQREDPDGQPRFHMLQTLRDYAIGLLDEEPLHQALLSERHAGHYLDLVHEMLPPGATAKKADIRRVQDDYDNVRAALTYWLDRGADATGAADKALELAGAMGHYWYAHGLSLMGSDWLERALAQAPEAPAATRAQALLALGIMSAQRQQPDRAMELLTRARELYQEVGDRTGEARCLNGAGIVAASAGRRAEAREHLQTAAALFDKLGDAVGQTDALDNLGVVYLHEGSWAQACDIFRTNLPRYKASGNDWGAACTALNLGVAYVLGGKAADAQEPIREAFEVFGEWQDPNGLTETLEAAVGLAATQGQWTPAARLAGAAETARQDLGVRGPQPDRARLDAWVVETARRLGEAAFEAARHEGGAMTPEQATTYALDEVIGR